MSTGGSGGKGAGGRGGASGGGTNITNRILEIELEYNRVKADKTLTSKERRNELGILQETIDRLRIIK